MAMLLAKITSMHFLMIVFSALTMAILAFCKKYFQFHKRSEYKLLDEGAEESLNDKLEELK